jgi:predicted metal-dependent phosphoesterase TrpH
VRLDTHVHTMHSGYSTIAPLRRVMRESYNSVENVYRRAKARGMDLVAITDHDTIDGALLIAERPDVVVGCEVTGVFPRDGVRVHLGVLGLTESQHREIQRLRHDIAELLPYLRQQRLFTSINHVASRINGSITAAHIAALLPWIDGVEIRNGSRLSSQNRTAAALAEAHAKVGIAGSDSHTGRGIGRRRKACVPARAASSAVLATFSISSRACPTLFTMSIAAAR